MYVVFCRMTIALLVVPNPKTMVHLVKATREYKNDTQQSYIKHFYSMARRMMMSIFYL